MTSLLLLMLTIQGSWSLALDKSLEEIRASLITKHNIQEHRDKKALESAGDPASFVVTTELKVNTQQVISDTQILIQGTLLYNNTCSALV